MINKKIKVLMSILVCITLLGVGCKGKDIGNENDSDSRINNEQQSLLGENEDNKTYVIGINQYMEHPSLEESRLGFIDRCNELGINIKPEYLNAQGDTSNAQMISDKFVKDNVDLIFTIGTSSTQTAKKATENSKIPVLFTAVTDPVYSEIVNSLDNVGGNVTGVVDKMEHEEIFKLIKDLNSDASKIGIIYSTGETNSEVQIAESQDAAQKLGYTIETVGISSINDIPQAISIIKKKADVMYMITDNPVATAIELVSKLAFENEIVTLSSVESQAADGILVANGVSFYQLGKQTADMAKKILIDGVDPSEISVESSKVLNKVVNVKTMEKLGFIKENKAFEDAEFVE